jgi:hypothetical protein
MSHSPLLKSRWGSDAEGELAFERFVAYKKRVPVCGIVMLNERPFGHPHEEFAFHPFTKTVFPPGNRISPTFPTQARG